MIGGAISAVSGTSQTLDLSVAANVMRASTCIIQRCLLNILKKMKMPMMQQMTMTGMQEVRLPLIIAAAATMTALGQLVDL